MSMRIRFKRDWMGFRRNAEIDPEKENITRGQVHAMQSVGAIEILPDVAERATAKRGEQAVDRGSSPPRAEAEATGTRHQATGQKKKKTGKKNQKSQG